MIWIDTVAEQGRDAMIKIEDAGTALVLPMAWFRARGFTADKPVRWGDLLDAFQGAKGTVEGEPGDWLTYQEASRYVNVKLSTLYYLVHAKRIPAYKTGKIVRFKRIELDKWLKKMPVA